MKKTVLLLFALGCALPGYSADELIMADDKKRECEVMMYQAGKFLVYDPDGKRSIVALDKIKSGSFEPPDELWNMVKMASGETTKILVRGYDENGFDTILSNGDEKAFLPNDIAAIKFRSKSTFLGAPKVAAGGKEGTTVDPAAARRITDDQIPDIVPTLTLDVPSKLVDGFVELEELRAQLEVYEADLSGSKSIENKRKKVEEELKEIDGKNRGIIEKEISRSRDMFEKIKEEVIRLDEKFTKASEKGKETDSIFEEKMKVVEEQKKYQAVIDAFYWNFIGLIGTGKPARGSIHEKVKRPAPSVSIYEFGKGHTSFDKKSRGGIATLVCFWSTQNRESQKALKLIQQVLAEYPDGNFQVYTVNVGDKMETLKTVMPKMPRMRGLHHAIDVVDAKQKTMVINYGVSLLPTFVMIDSNGTVESAQIGYSSKWKDYYEDKLELMLNQKPDF